MTNVLVTGGCGFIGTNLVLDRLQRGDTVRVLDSCARAGSERNWQSLQRHARNGHLELIRGDVRDAEAVARATQDIDAVFHLAAQVAVTTSVSDPRFDFDVNAGGTLNVLEAARQAKRPPAVIFASTNKVYGALEGQTVGLQGERYEFTRLRDGVDEAAPLDFHSPYGCSKGSADQYVRDYARIYGLRTAVMRQSCIYGPWQLGNEDQGWVAHFAMQAMHGEPVTIYGDGFQVRDVLFVDDLLRVYDVALRNIDRISGAAYNIGGGPPHSISVIECVRLLGRLLGREVSVSYGAWRPGDQRVYVSNAGRAERDLGWRPTTSFEEGLRRMIRWIETDEASGSSKTAVSARGSISRQEPETNTSCAA
jgi:CDP-paratose 2-epimerase